MTPTAPLRSDHSAMESLLAFWADAGIDVCLEDEPVNRLAEAARLIRPAPSPVVNLVTARPSNPAQQRASNEAAALEQAKSLAAEAQTLEALTEALGSFDGCGLRRNPAHQPVLWRGPAASKIMIIAEAPLAEDETEARPGPEGQLLDRMLQAAGLKDRCILTHTVFWHAPGGRAPSLAEQKICQPFLERAIGLIQPQYLLLLGAASARAMLGREDGILALRGQWFDWTASDEGQTLPALVTMTPSFLLQQPTAKKKAWADLQSFNARALGG